jgi:hypothetical protein
LFFRKLLEMAQDALTVAYHRVNLANRFRCPLGVALDEYKHVLVRLAQLTAKSNDGTL